MKLRRQYTGSNSITVTIPWEIIRILRWRAGSEVEVVRENDHVIIRKLETEEFDVPEKARRKARK